MQTLLNICMAAATISATLMFVAFAAFLIGIFYRGMFGDLR